jgi:hypothetical protein
VIETYVRFSSRQGSDHWDVTENTSYVQSINFPAPGSRDMHNANNKVVDYLFCALCKPEFDQVFAENLACKIWDKLKVANSGNN